MSPEEIKSLAETLQIATEIVQTKPNEWFPVYAALGGAFTGAIASFFPTYLLDRSRERRHSRRLLAALLAEISSILEIIKHRKYKEILDRIIDNLKEEPLGRTSTFTIDSPLHYSRIFQENCSNIGAIDKLNAPKIVIFHQLIDAAVQDVKLGGIFSNGADIHAFKETEKIFAKTIKIGNELVK